MDFLELYMFFSKDDNSYMLKGLKVGFLLITSSSLALSNLHQPPSHGEQKKNFNFKLVIINAPK
jgi:hypothetical protein